ncbi:MAG: hypothetical protein QNJ30_19620 [Kiloniellales bacterium]|nr:hypothetical protein [Kiloniellales bacterium]
MTDVIDTLDDSTIPEEKAGVERGPIICKGAFFNETGRTIEVKELTHSIDGNKRTLLRNKTVGNGQAVKSNDVHSYSGVPVNDYWYLEIVMDGKTYSNDSFSCNLGEDDNKGTVYFRVYQSYFYLDRPARSSCYSKMKKRS